MKLQVLSSGSEGNALLVRADEFVLLADAGLPGVELARRLEQARVPLGAPHAVAVTHGHLDHARSAGLIARRTMAPVYAAPSLHPQPSVRRAKRMVALGALRPCVLCDPFGRAALELTAVEVPHDAHPTYALRFDAGGRRAVLLTDMGRPEASIAPHLAGAHVLVLEFNHDAERLAAGTYPDALKRRIRGGRGHLENGQARQVLRHLAGPELHTLVLAHLSRHNNTPELARAAAQAELTALGLDHVEVLVASQDEIGPAIDV
jgi:phosphoribosyl 1,2-cyclic phosphodiesterase